MYRIIKTGKYYQLQKKIWGFFWRTIKHYNNTVSMFNTVEKASQYDSLYCFKTFEEAENYYKHNTGFEVIRTYD